MHSIYERIVTRTEHRFDFHKLPGPETYSGLVPAPQIENFIEMGTGKRYSILDICRSARYHLACQVVQN